MKTLIVMALMALSFTAHADDFFSGFSRGYNNAQAIRQRQMQMQFMQQQEEYMRQQVEYQRQMVQLQEQAEIDNRFKEMRDEK